MKNQGAKLADRYRERLQSRKMHKADETRNEWTCRWVHAHGHRAADPQLYGVSARLFSETPLVTIFKNLGVKL